MNVVAVANQKGGVGKTTTSVNLSVALALAGKRVLLADLDPQANATSALGIECEGLPTLYHAITGQVPPADTALATRFANLSIIPSDMDLAGAEVELARQENHLQSLRAMVDNLRHSIPHEYLIIDCPPSLGILMTGALAAADQVLVPLQCEYFALEGLSKILRVIEEIRSSGANPGVKVGGIVMTMFDLRTNLSQQVVAEVRKHFAGQVYQTVIPRTVRLGEAPSFGKSIHEYDPRGPGALAYQALAAEFLQREAGQIRFVN